MYLCHQIEISMLNFNDIKQMNMTSSELPKKYQDLLSPTGIDVIQTIVQLYMEKGDYLTFSSGEEPEYILIYYGEYTETKRGPEDCPEAYHLETNCNYAFAILSLKDDELFIRDISQLDRPLRIPDEIWEQRHRFKKADFKLESLINHKLKERKLRFIKQDKKLISGNYVFERDDIVVYAPVVRFGGIKPADCFIGKVRESDYRLKQFSICNAVVYLESGKVELNDQKREIAVEPDGFRIASEAERKMFYDTLKTNNIIERGWQYIDLDNQLNEFRLGDVVIINGYATIPAEKPVPGSKCFKVYAWGNPSSCRPMIMFDKKCTVLDLIIDTDKEVEIVKPSSQELDKFHNMLKKYHFPMNLLQRKLLKKRHIYHVVYSNKTNKFVVKNIPESKKSIKLKDVFETEHLAYARCDEYNDMLEKKRNPEPDDKALIAATQQAMMQNAGFLY